MERTFHFLPVWTIAGALICGLVLYRFSPGAAGEGIPSYLRSLHTNKGVLNPKETFFKFWAALTTLGTFGNGGIVGPLGRVSAGIMSFFAVSFKRLKFNDWDIRTATICGLAATVGTIFHSSIGGGVFAVEIVQKSEMRYRDLFPAILSSSTAVFISKAFGWHSFYPINAVPEFMSPGLLWVLILFALLIGFAGKAFTALYILAARIFKREKNRQILLKVVAGSMIAGFGVWFLNPELMGTSKNIIAALFEPDIGILYGNLPQTIPLFVTLAVMAAAKAAGNCITVGSGMSAGFTGPAAIIGMLLGAGWADIFQLTPGSANYSSVIAAGFAGMLGSTMNIPIAAAILTIESFGLQYSFPAGIAAIIAFQVNRHDTIYSYSGFK
jgi:chloride channel protein, CIC family